MHPLLSILIATRNRIPYCISSIKTILSFNYDNFELVVQDNSDSLELRQYVEEKITDKRLIYNYTPPPFSSIDNFNAVIGLANGKYLCMIGDDDGINPEIISLVEWANRNSIQAITPGLNVLFRWPDACVYIKGLENENGNFEIREISGQISYINAGNALKKLMTNGTQNYLSIKLPKLYHGIVLKSVLYNIKEKTGHFVGGLSPDIYLSVAISSIIEKYVLIDYPITIPGVCAEPFKRGHLTKFKSLEDAPHFRNRGKYEWSQDVPAYYSANTIWADSALAAIRELKLEYFYRFFNYKYLIIQLLKKDKDYKSTIIEHYYSLTQAKSPIQKFYVHARLLVVYCIEKIKEILTKVVHKLMRKTNHKSFSTNIYNFSNVQNIKIATKILSKYLLEKSLAIDKIVVKIKK
jgi:glycosyltransferase involved in cell wall biosynthesis